MIKAAEANSSDNINFVFIVLSQIGLVANETGLSIIKCQKLSDRKTP